MTDIERDGHAEPAKTPEPRSSGDTVPRIDASTLLAGGRGVVLAYKGMDYLLRVTSNDKLILTK